MRTLNYKIKKIFLIAIISILISIFSFYYFSDIINSSTISFIIASHNINLYPSNRALWTFVKNIYIYFQLISSVIISYYFISLYNNITDNNYMIFNKFFVKPTNHIKAKHKKIIIEENIKKPLELLIGTTQDNQSMIIPENSLYQNILVTGSIGSGKTSSAMYPFTKQLIEYSAKDSIHKIGMLILDVKGNYYNKVLEYAEKYNRKSDVIVIQINGPFNYNPLHKPNLKASIIANQLKDILLLFSPNNSESYWIDKSEEVLREAIKLCRLYNSNYVTFDEIHKIVTQQDYYLEKVEFLRRKFLNNQLSKEDIYNLLSCLNFFNKEFYSLDARTLNILKSEITRITNCFVSDFEVTKTFCPLESDLNFYGFSEIINSGKIVVLNMNINEYRNLSKIIAAYLKIDFQTAVLSQLSNNKIIRTTAFISDEYSEYVTANDAIFYSQSREAKCINIISTQSYTSLLNTLTNQYSAKVLIQNLVNKIWFRNDDIFTIEDAQKQCGKIEKKHTSTTFSENAKTTSYNMLTKTLHSKDSNISESINTYSQLDFNFDTNFFTQQLESFTALCFLSDGNKIIKPQKINMLPYFRKNT